MGKTVAYGRVSTKGQADAGALERQERTLLETIDADEVILDVGSGKKTDRPGYQRLLELIRTGTISRVVVKEQDRLNRNVRNDLDLWALCDAYGVSISDVHGREVEFRTPDGQLLSTVLSALAEHRSNQYGMKIRDGLDKSRKSGRPARHRHSFPFGYRPTRNEHGRPDGVEQHPEQADLARQRIELFLAGASLSECCRQILELQGARVRVNSFGRWLRHPYLRGRLCWKVRPDGSFEQVAPKPTFRPLLTDAEAHLITTRLDDVRFNVALRDRQRRTFSGLCRCSECGYGLSYRVDARNPNNVYLRCKNHFCSKRSKSIRTDLIQEVVRYSLAEHAKHLVPLLDAPKVDPPEVAQLEKEIKQLQGISGTESVVEAKRAEINSLRSAENELPRWMVIATARSERFWAKPEAELNQTLRTLVDHVSIDFRGGASEAVVAAVMFKTSPAEGPLPADQRDVVIERNFADHLGDAMRAHLDQK